MAKISHISLDSISRGETARAIRLAIGTRVDALLAAKRITKISHKTITIL